MAKKRFVQVGHGGRSIMFNEAICKEFKDSSEIVGLCDSNAGRLALAAKTLKDEFGVDLPTYNENEFDKMIQETQPDSVIVTTKDSSHDEYICRAMELGCDVVTEKPMTTDVNKCQKIIDTQNKTGKKCTVTFNYRYAPPRTQIKDLLMSGTIGDVLSVDFHWMLDTSHGADYFRRWHRHKKNSGGLMVHKSTHHFDLVNWWLSDIPERIFASGQRKFYTPQTGDRYGLTNRSERCHTCPEASRCAFEVNLKENEHLKKLYLDNEEYDGYLRDKCVFSEDMDIEDNMNVLIDYKKGTKLTYSLNAFSPWEGYLVSFNGTRGRIEHMCQEKVYINGDGTIPGALKDEGTWTKIFPHWQPAYGVDIWKGDGGHGGADPVMLAYIFDAENQEKDQYLRAADQRSGAYSIICGIAANISMAEGKAVNVDSLISGVDSPDYPAMPDASDSLSMIKLPKKE